MKHAFGMAGMFALLAAALVAAGASAGERTCLRGKSGPSAPDEGCTHDPLHLGNMPEVKALVAAYGLSSTTVKLVGCQQGKFATTQDLDSDHAYEITYVYHSGSERQSFVLPIAHELAHVWQCERSGSLGKLMEEEPTPQIELGADFLAGRLAKNCLHRESTSDFHFSVELLGDYSSNDPDSHGTPEERTESFRRGFYYEPALKNLGDEYRDFQRNLYGKVTGGSK